MEDNIKTIIAVPRTTKRFGPSGSLKNTNIILDKPSAVMAKSINEDFFDLKFIILNYYYD
jgi:hypothetical protein